MKFDDILGHLGYTGRYQTLVILALSLANIPTAFHQLGQVFFAANVDFWCSSSYTKITDCPSGFNLTKKQCNEAAESFLALSKDDNCNEFVNLTYESYLRSFVSGDDLTNVWPVRSCNNWTYDTSQYKSTIIQEWNLVCEDDKKPAIAQSVFFAGVFIGSLLFGALSDRFGRKRVFFIGVVTVGVSGLAVSFSPSYTVYTTLRLIVAIANVGIFMQVSIMTVEWVGPSHRKTTSFLTATTWAIGYMIFALLAYLLPKWRMLSIVSSVSVFFILGLYPFIPESPRWLIMQGRLKEAEKIIQTAARINKVTLPENLFDEKKPVRSQGTVLDLYRTKNMRRKTLILMYIWFVNSCVYYGLSLSTSELGVNDYLAFMVSGAVEIPANLLLVLIVDHTGRRPALFCSMAIGGVACILGIFVPDGFWRIFTAMCGKFSITFSFTLAYLFSKEIFPTPVRSTGLGITSTSARVGSILSPFILYIQHLWEPIPYIIFGSLSISAGLIGLLLPETTGLKLPETIQDGVSTERKTAKNTAIELKEDYEEVQEDQL